MHPYRRGARCLHGRMRGLPRGLSKEFTQSRRVYRSCRCCRRTKPSRFCAVARCICRQGPADARPTRRTGPAGPWHDHGRESAGATQGAQIPPLFVIESELRLAMVKAELEFVNELVSRLTEDRWGRSMCGAVFIGTLVVLLVHGLSGAEPAPRSPSRAAYGEPRKRYGHLLRD